MLMVVGLPAATVTPWARISSKNRVAENFLRITSVAPRHSGPSTPNSCADPVEGAEIVDAISGRQAESLRHRRDVADLLAVAQHDAPGAIGGTRGEEDNA